MRERPILFSAPMIQAILSGSKTQTRRLLKAKTLRDLELGHQLGECFALEDPRSIDCGYIQSFCPYGQIGDQLWVRESWYQKGTVCRSYPDDDEYHFFGHKQAAYVADGDAPKDWTVKKRPSIHMPRWASRIQLEITNIRVERLNDISEQDAAAEGIENIQSSPEFSEWYGTKSGGNSYAAFKYLWLSINGPDSWAMNPWVWVVEFKVIQGGAV